MSYWCVLRYVRTCVCVKLAPQLIVYTHTYMYVQGRTYVNGIVEVASSMVECRLIMHGCGAPLIG